jgi:hypothetical protein
MCDGHHLLDGVKEKHRHAICKAHEQGNIRSIGHDGIRFLVLRIEPARPPWANHIRAVNLPDVKDSFYGPFHCCEDSAPVFDYILARIPIQASQIEGFPRLRANAAMPRENALHNVRTRE